MKLRPHSLLQPPPREVAQHMPARAPLSGYARGFESPEVARRIARAVDAPRRKPGVLDEAGFAARSGFEDVDDLPVHSGFGNGVAESDGWGFALTAALLVSGARALPPGGPAAAVMRSWSRSASRSTSSPPGSNSESSAVDARAGDASTSADDDAPGDAAGASAGGPFAAPPRANDERRARSRYWASQSFSITRIKLIRFTQRRRARTSCV